MSIVPLIVNLAREFENDYHRDWDHHFMDDDFGFGIHPMDIFRPHLARSHLMLHPRRRSIAPYDRNQILARRAARLGRGGADGGLDKTGAMMPTVGKDGFQVCMDVSQFKPNELNVKTIDNTVVIEGKHEEREDDHGMIERHFVRKYTLPKDYDAKEVVSTISSDGVLTVKAPPPPNKAIKQKERVVQIQQTGPAHLNIKAPPEQKDDKQQSNGEKMETGK